MQRGYLFWGTILILLGGLLLLNAAEIPLPGNVHPIELFWPTVLVLLGIWIMVGALWGGRSDQGETRSIDLRGAREASLRLNYGAGRLKLAAGAPAGKFLTGNFSGSLDEKSVLSGDRLDVRLNMGPFPFFPLIGGGSFEWDMQLNRDVPISLRVEMGAAESDFDLRDLQVTDLRLNTGASKTNLTLPAKAGTMTVKVELGAASLDIALPDGVAGRIRVEQGITAIEVDTDRYPYANGIYESADYSSAQNRADILIQAGAGRVAVR
jgi:hypothetical protein